MGRPSSFNPEVAIKICERLASGESLGRVCGDDGFPHVSTVFQWVHKDIQGFAAQYARARAFQSDYYAEEIIAITDETSNDFKYDDDGNEIVDHEHIQRSKLRVDTRKWLMSKLAPKKYGEKQAIEHSGPDGGPIETLDTSKVPLGELTRLVDMLGSTNGAVPVKVLENGANGNGNGRH